MKTTELVSSKYLKKEDFPQPAILTVAQIKKENVAIANQEPKYRGVMYFQEMEKGLVLNTTNLKRATKFFGSDDTDDWEGKKICVYNDENVEFGGDIVGGLRLRSAVVNRPPVNRPVAQKTGNPVHDMDDSIPWDDDLASQP